MGQSSKANSLGVKYFDPSKDTDGVKRVDASIWLNFLSSIFKKRLLTPDG
jgi:hypothetical protein